MKKFLTLFFVSVIFSISLTSCNLFGRNDSIQKQQPIEGCNNCYRTETRLVEVEVKVPCANQCCTCENADKKDLPH